MTTLLAGRYRLDSRIGAGAMGQVWRAVDERLGREVAVKTVDLRGVTDPSVAERFRREAVATARLSHPSIVTIFDSGTDGDTAFLVMELLRGDPVSTLIRRDGRLPVKQSAYIAGRVGQALDAAHEIGIVHRDIKPSNVMVDGGTVTLLDFGIAALISDAAHLTLTQPATTIGTAAYMSPEQALGERPTPASDVYSLGCLLMTMLTGAPPFIADNPIAVAHAQIADVPPRVSSRRPDVPWELDDLVRRMLAKEAGVRPSAQTVVARLASIAAGATPPGTPSAMDTQVMPPAPHPPPAASPTMATQVVPPKPPTPPGAADAMATRVVPPPRPSTPPPMGTQVMPTVELTTGNGVGSAARTPVSGAGTPTPSGPPTPNWFGRGLKIIAIVLVVLFLALIAANALPRLANWIGGSLFSTTSASPTPAKKPTPSKAPKPKTSLKPSPIEISLPPLPTLPTMDDLTLKASVEGMRLAIDQLSPTDDRSAEAKDDLLDSWDSASDDLLSGEDARSSLKSFTRELDRQHRKGGITTPEYLTLRATLEGIQLLV